MTVTIPAITVPATIITPVHPNIVLPQPLPYEPWRGPVFVEP
ncbi:MAG TPA: hypothetical protein VGY48_16020 [Vicinamibacterales bacterium]|nr:hypothetical protein [Vicinamibacterales bacterium]